jgi:predicted DNA-binding transcriptional regulator AlpA
MTTLWSCPNPGCPLTESAPRDVEELNGSAADESRTSLSPKELAEFAGVSLNTVYQWNQRGSGPPYYWLGNHIKYRLSGVKQWSSERRKQLAAVCSSECGRTYRRDAFTQVEAKGGEDQLL